MPFARQEVSKHGETAVLTCYRNNFHLLGSNSTRERSRGDERRIGDLTEHCSMQLKVKMIEIVEKCTDENDEDNGGEVSDVLSNFQMLRTHSLLSL
eukprot:748515-Hanusia_phi.AAC.2